MSVKQRSTLANLFGIVVNWSDSHYVTVYIWGKRSIKLHLNGQNRQEMLIDIFMDFI